MVNFLKQLENPQMNNPMFYEVMRDFRKGGLNPTMYDDFLNTIKSLPPIAKRKPKDYEIFDKFGLTDISEEDFSAIMGEIIRRGIAKSKFCWHPEAGSTTCSIDAGGNIHVSAAHSIQNNGVLSKLVEDGHVMSYVFDNGEIIGKEFGKNRASIFWGFCNKHDAIFNSIETQPYTNTPEQNFLFAYRGFVVSSHKKIEVASWINFGEQSDNDIKENKRIFDEAILKNNYAIIHTEVFELPSFYPIAVSSAFYLDFDFEGNPIKHSEERMEDVYVTLYPADKTTYFLLSYFEIDTILYGELGNQLRKRNKLKSDITMLIAAHTDNVFFNPVYYKTFIQKYEKILKEIMFQTQADYGVVGKDDKLDVEISLTPSNYLDNPNNINFFGY
jgi:hypothetical protein